MTGVKLERVTKSFGLVDVIHGIDLDIADQEFVVFVGPSGCGKSTLLRMISGLEKCDSGTIHIGARDVTNLEPSQRGISMVFQSYALYPHMTVEENIGFGLLSNGVDKAEVKRLVTDAAKSLQLEELLKRKPKALSGGQRQRVAIGRSIVRNPDVFLFDEPLSNLDAELRVHMRIEIAHLHKRIGATMIYVTHDQVEAMTLADKIVVLQSGKIEQVGAPLELFDNPSNQFVAGFIGSPKMNFLPGTVAKKNGDMINIQLFGSSETEVTLPVTETKLAEGQQVTIGIRPEHFDTPGSTGSELTVKCDVTEQMGEVTYIHADASDGTHLVVERRNDRSIKDGDLIELIIPTEKAFLFDALGARIR